MIASRGTSFLMSFLLLALCSLCFSRPAHAQLDIPNMESSLLLSSVPQYPRPGDTVHLHAQSVFYDLSKSSNTWTVNDKVIAQGTGVVEATYVAGTLGSTGAIVFKTDSDTTTATARMDIIPTEVDLLFESNSYVPPFYRGRALPSEGSMVRLLAIPRFLRPDGSVIAASSLVYTWKQNGSVIVSVSGKGKNSVLLPSPVLFGTDIVEVDVATVDGSMSGTQSISVPSVKPLVLLYEDRPLLGVMYHQSLGSSAASESEATFAAIPYFADVTDLNDPSLSYDWVVNNQHITPDNTKKNALTISSAGQPGGSALVRLDLSHPQNPFFSASGEWHISFSDSRGGKSGDANNPFLQQ